MKRKLTRKNVYKLRSWSKLFIEWIKRGKNFVEPIVHVDNGSFDL